MHPKVLFLNLEPLLNINKSLWKLQLHAAKGIMELTAKVGEEKSVLPLVHFYFCKIIS